MITYNKIFCSLFCFILMTVLGGLVNTIQAHKKDIITITCTDEFITANVKKVAAGEAHDSQTNSLKDLIVWESQALLQDVITHYPKRATPAFKLFIFLEFLSKNPDLQKALGTKKKLKVDILLSGAKEAKRLKITEKDIFAIKNSSVISTCKLPDDFLDKLDECTLGLAKNREHEEEPILVQQKDKYEVTYLKFLEEKFSEVLKQYMRPKNQEKCKINVFGCDLFMPWDIHKLTDITSPKPDISTKASLIIYNDLKTTNIFYNPANQPRKKYFIRPYASNLVDVFTESVLVPVIKSDERLTQLFCRFIDGIDDKKLLTFIRSKKQFAKLFGENINYIDNDDELVLAIKSNEQLTKVFNNLIHGDEDKRLLSFLNSNEKLAELVGDSINHIDNDHELVSTIHFNEELAREFGGLIKDIYCENVLLSTIQSDQKLAKLFDGLTGDINKIEGQRPFILKKDFWDKIQNLNEKVEFEELIEFNPSSKSDESIKREVLYRFYRSLDSYSKYDELLSDIDHKESALSKSKSLQLNPFALLCQTIVNPSSISYIVSDVIKKKLPQCEIYIDKECTTDDKENIKAYESKFQLSAAFQFMASILVYCYYNRHYFEDTLRLVLVSDNITPSQINDINFSKIEEIGGNVSQKGKQKRKLLENLFYLEINDHIQKLKNQSGGEATHSQASNEEQKAKDWFYDKGKAIIENIEIISPREYFSTFSRDPVEVSTLKKQKRSKCVIL